MCGHWYPDIHFNGKNYRDFITTYWPAALQNSTNPINKLVLQDGDPVQKSRQANLAYETIGKIFSIPARSPDMNYIENLLNLVRCVQTFSIFILFQW